MTFRTCFTRWPERLPAGRGAPARAMLDVVYQYRLEPARVADAALLAGMSQELVESGLKPAWDAARIAWHIRHPDSVVLAARAGTAVVGFAIMRYADDTAHLNLLDVARQLRGDAAPPPAP